MVTGWLKSITATVFLLLLGACAKFDEISTSRLDTIKRRGELQCGISGRIPGFSFLGSDGLYTGLDVDICRALAAAFVGDAEAVSLRQLTAAERFTALQTGEIDILSRNTTTNLSRDAIGGNSLSFAPVVFHDGQGILVRRGSGISKLEDLQGKSICVGSGTTTEQNLSDVLQSRGIAYEPVKYQDVNQVLAGYQQRRCAAITSDRSQLAAAKSALPNKNEHIILREVMSKEPLAPATIGGDQRLADATRWVIHALVAAEEMGITQENIEEKLEEVKQDPRQSKIRRFLGVEGGLGSKLGLPNDFVVRAILATGNYGEIYERNLGVDSNISIPRGLNHTYRNGGLLIAPPFN
ncbi:amino acid ABC transporter substrate-binding protein [cyanobiont of Ornithocercus magnificus]|nr:amino acid ABC transporter substrate-binding protein [cyanobiont of Ornithocercus magnificus]